MILLINCCRSQLMIVTVSCLAILAQRVVVFISNSTVGSASLRKLERVGLLWCRLADKLLLGGVLASQIFGKRVTPAQ